MNAVGFSPSAPRAPALPRVREDAQRPDAAPDPLRPDAAAGAEKPGPDGLTAPERAQRDAMAARDREVRAHEQAHATVGGRYAGAPSYDFEMGPDRRRYAVSGEVAIDTTPVEGDPEATIAKMRIVAAAALAPARPSAQDQAVAAYARAQQALAQAELAAHRRAEAAGEAEAVSRRV